MILDPDAVRRALTAPPPEPAPGAGLRPAAVLLPLFVRDSEEHVLFTRRTEGLPHHRGEISFPGGGQHPEDADLAATALRETEEEVGISASEIAILGRLDEAVSVYGYHVTPFVGRITDRRSYRVNPAEIDEVIEVPLARLRDPGVFHVENWRHKGRRHPVHFYTLGRHCIWGLTAGILSNFLERLEQHAG